MPSYQTLKPGILGSETIPLMNIPKAQLCQELINIKMLTKEEKELQGEIKGNGEAGVVVSTYNPSIWEAEVGGGSCELEVSVGYIVSSRLPQKTNKQAKKTPNA